ncbi:MAG: hypothetical protein ABSB82_07365 [Terriglobia bacterium]|jgi:hypothetical protein
MSAFGEGLDCGAAGQLDFLHFERVRQSIQIDYRQGLANDMRIFVALDAPKSASYLIGKRRCRL